jgi:hypothetical protein
VQREKTKENVKTAARLRGVFVTESAGISHTVLPPLDNREKGAVYLLII